MAHNPSAIAFDGNVTLFNFTHYDTDDLVRLLEAPLTARRRSQVLDPNTEPKEKMEIHICYSHSLAGAKAKLIGYNWRHDGIRVVQPHKLHSNPVEALADTSRELPLDAVVDLLEIANRLFGGRVSWDNRRTRGDIDLRTLALGIRVAIRDTVAARKPRGYHRRAYSMSHSMRGARRALNRVRYAAKSADVCRQSLLTLQRHAASAGMSHLVQKDLLDRIYRFHTEARSIEEEVYSIYQIIDKEIA